MNTVIKNAKNTPSQLEAEKKKIKDGNIIIEKTKTSSTKNLLGVQTQENNTSAVGRFSFL
ncbi:hypothetical protein I8D50_004223 [Vibrio vulnificus]|nr:hypothetical protein [Vibrio vulnificus]